MKATSNLSWNTGTATPITLGSTAPSQETQCMKISNAIWIANNEDGDSTTQRNFLDALGINTYLGLVELTQLYGTNLLPFNRGKLALKKVDPKRNLLAYMIGGIDNWRGLQPAMAFAVNGNAVNTPYSLSSINPPPTDGIVFVSGSYQGDEETRHAASLHAEQKLLAALGKYMAANPNWRGDVKLGGIKMPCSKCLPVVNTVTDRVRLRVRINQDLTTTLKDIRAMAKISLKGASGVRQLDIDHYFPA